MRHLAARAWRVRPPGDVLHSSCVAPEGRKAAQFTAAGSDLVALQRRERNVPETLCGVNPVCFECWCLTLGCAV